MVGTIQIPEFVEYLKQNDLVIMPRTLAENRHEEIHQEKIKRVLKKKQALTFREISDANLWGEKITPQAIRAYAFKHARPDEIFPGKKGKKEIHKISITAVERIAKMRGQLWD